jgi:hypothetical protein
MQGRAAGCDMYFYLTIGAYGVCAAKSHGNKSFRISKTFVKESDGAKKRNELKTAFLVSAIFGWLRSYGLNRIFKSGGGVNGCISSFSQSGDPIVDLIPLPRDV